MLTKKFTPKRTVCKVTFTIPAELVTKEVALVGDFNEWDTEATKLAQNGDVFETELRLKPETEYKFRYLIDGEVWENDHEADGYVPNEFGTDDSVLIIGS